MSLAKPLFRRVASHQFIDPSNPPRDLVYSCSLMADGFIAFLFLSLLPVVKMLGIRWLAVQLTTLIATVGELLRDAMRQLKGRLFCFLCSDFNRFRQSGGNLQSTWMSEGRKIRSKRRIVRCVTSSNEGQPVLSAQGVHHNERRRTFGNCYTCNS